MMRPALIGVNTKLLQEYHTILMFMVICLIACGVLDLGHGTLTTECLMSSPRCGTVRLS